jgi:hypothetical protein
MEINYNNINSGDVLITDNGNFMIVSIGVCEPEYFGWGAMYIDDECEYPVEIQYMHNELEDLINEIMKDCKIIDINIATILVD